MDVELHQPLLRVLMPHIADRQIHQKIIIGLPPLQELLATLDVLHEVAGIAPNGVCGRHIYGGIELPAGPRIVFGREAGAVEQHPIDTCAEHQVQVGLHL